MAFDWETEEGEDSSNYSLSDKTSLNFIDPTTGQYTDTYFNGDGSLKSGYMYDDSGNIVSDPANQNIGGGTINDPTKPYDPNAAALTPAERDALDKAGVDKTLWGSLSTAAKKAFVNPDGSYNIASLGALAGAGFGAYKALTDKPVMTGYQGSIPKYDAHRNMITAPPSDRRPGAGGVNYGGDVTYTPRGSGIDAAAVPGGSVTQPNPDGKPQQGGNDIDFMNEQARQWEAANPTPKVNPYDMPPLQTAAQGGIMGYAKGRYLQGNTDGMADKIPAQIGRDQPAALSHGEFVVPADVVSHLGNGNSDAGAKKLYQMMDRIRMARTGTKQQGKQINPNKFMPGGNVGYASGGAVQRYADGGATTSGVGTAANAGVRGTESNLSNWAGDYVTDMLGKGQALSNMPYQAYQGPLTAGASNLQNQAFNQASNLSVPSGINQAANTAGNISTQAQNMSYAPTTFGNQFNAPTAYQAGSFGNQFQAPTQSAATDFTNQYKAPTAYDTTQFSTGQFGTQQAQQYMNPYLQSALNPQLEEARRQSQITQMQNDAKMTGAGAYGGGRQAILNAETQRSLGTNLANITGQGYNTAFTNAQQQFNADQARQLQAQQAQEASKQFGYGQGMSAAQLQAQYGLSAQQAQEAARQFNQGQSMTAAQQAAQYGLAGQQAGEASRQFAAGQGMTAAQQAAQYGLAGQQASEASKQFGANYGLQGLNTALQGAQTQGQLGTAQNQAQLGNLNALAGLGGTQRGIESEGIAADKAAFEEARANPYKMVQYQQSLLSGLPLAAQSYNMAAIDPLTSAAGSATTLGTLLEKLGLGGTKAVAQPQVAQPQVLPAAK